MYRMWLDQSEFELVKEKLFLKILRIDKDGTVFVECGSSDDWKLLNALLAVTW